MLVSATDLTLVGDHILSVYYTLNRYNSISSSTQTIITLYKFIAPTSPGDQSYEINKEPT